ncbi:MAG: prolyl oligopeptidase family serine peptidase [Alphaproteobacteria bacterium]|nr:prolyl oligopeptidase family serine peptidase [Alphaproteobacteria bacterium]
MRRVALSVALALSLGGCSSLNDLPLLGIGDQPAQAVQPTESKTPGLAIDRREGQPPYAAMKGTVLVAPNGAKRVDYFYWLNEKNTQKVFNYLQAENKYASEMMAHTADLQEKLRAEIKQRAAANQGTPPFKVDGYYYYERYAPNADYPVIARRKGSLSAPEEIVFDEQPEGSNHQQFHVGDYAASPDGRIFAYAADYEGDRWYTILFKDLATGQMLPDKFDHVASDIAFASDNKTVFYLKLQPGTARSYRLMRHVLGSDPKSDKVVFEEKDEQFNLSLKRSKGGRYLLLTSSQTKTSDVRFVDAAKPTAAWTIVRARATGVRYFAEEIGGTFYIRTNLDAPDYRIVSAKPSAPSTWSDVVPQRPGSFIDAFVPTATFIALDEHEQGSGHVRIHDLKSGRETVLPLDDPAGYMAAADDWRFPEVRNTDPAATSVRVGYMTMAVPKTIMEFEPATGRRAVIQRADIPGYSPSAYAVERQFATASDGARIPVTIAYRRDKVAKDGKAPLLVMAYGAYGLSYDPIYRDTFPSLLDRGFVLAYAHVRGGREMGEAWYEAGKLNNKKNTFTDFIAATEYLVKAGYGDPKRVFATGRSAGGLTVGAVVNMRPDLYRGVVADVPFVDVVTTMLDDSIPLTTFEYDEWGNPAELVDYSTMLAYSPYDNVGAKAYPAMLVTAGYNDSQVGYFEPAKWVAKLRRNKTDQNLLLLRTNMGAGHAGDSGRFGRVEQEAFTLAFLLDQAGMGPPKLTPTASK